MLNEGRKREGALSYIIALLTIFALNFILPRMMPGNPLQAIYGDEALVAMTPQMEAHLTELFALDKSWSEQMVAYVLALLQGNLGFSYYYKDEVSSVIMGALPWTLLLVSLSLLIATVVGVMLGIESGYRRGERIDRGLLAGLMLLGGLPHFFLGIVLLLIFGVSLNLFPLSGALTPYSGLEGIPLVADIARHLALPLAALVLVDLGGIYLLTRNTVVTILKEGFMLTARAKGCSEFCLRYSHAGRNALLPVTTATGLRIPQLITEALFIEIVFSYPGLGLMLRTALDARDYPLIQGILLLVTITVLFANMFVDHIYKRLDPRIRYAH